MLTSHRGADTEKHMGGAEAVWIALGGNAAFLAVAAFLGRAIIRQWLDKNLEGYKQQLHHASQAELEQLRSRNAEQLEHSRHRLETLLRQTSKLHEKEFAVLADIWEKLNEALGHVARLVSAVQQYPDLDRMEDDRFESFVGGSQLDETDRASLRRIRRGDRNDAYQERIVWYRLRDAKNACTGLHREIQRNSIFLEPSIRSRFLRIDQLAWDALISREIGHEAGDQKFWLEAGTKLNKEIAPLKTEIESLVQKRLGYDSNS